MILYHVSRELDIKDEFNPRIPFKDRMSKGEECITPRLCVSESIKGALTAIPRDYGDITEMQFRVYEFDSEENFVVYFDELYRKEYVVDAEITKESWILNQKIIPKKTYLIQVLKYDNDLENAIPYSKLEYYNNKVKLDPDNWGEELDEVGGFSLMSFKEIEYEIIFN